MSNDARKVTKISNTPAKLLRRKRVAAYARVSNGKDAMLQSLSAQISYYNKYIQQRGDWEFAGIYADEAITGTKDVRAEFQRMLTDCRDGKIDMVITKSITRFARNTVILLETVRELKLLGIDVFFEKENIHSISADGEFMLTLLASYAQEESRSASENQKWRIRRKFEKGLLAGKIHMYGYTLLNGKLYVMPEEAEVVKMIFADYLSGMGINAIMKKLNAKGITTKNGNRWHEYRIMDILRNEKYTGDMMLQKTFRLDHISKKKQINRGELPMYHVIGSHEAITDKATFEKVQEEIKRRSAKYQPYPQTPKQYPFSSMIRCGQCGKYYRRKITAAGSKYAKPIWICTTFNTHGKDACSSQQIPENILIEKTMAVLDLTELDEAALSKYIAEIQVTGHHQLVYIFKDGHAEEVAWQNPSRRESWTEEMKQIARDRQNAIMEGRKKDE